MVVMGHGLGAERAHGLEPFARAFAGAGLAALTFDYRHLGESGGEPRRIISPRKQVEDYRAALRFGRGRDELDRERIGLWGTSFSGGHVLEVAASGEEGIRAVVSQIPFTSGWASTLAYPLRYHLRAIALGLADRVAGWLGRGPVMAPLTSESGFAVLASPDSHPGYGQMMGPNAPPPRPVAARVFLEILGYHPGRRASRVRAPTLVVVAEADAICPPGATRRAARRLPRGEVASFPMGHFDPYTGEWFQRVSRVETAFLARHLAPEAG